MERRIARRTLMTLLAVAPAAAVLAACGSEPEPASDETAPPTPLATDAPPATSDVNDAVDGEQDADVGVVLEWGNYGGFTPRRVSFQMQPMLYVTTDNRVITPGVEPAIYPGSLVPSNFVQSITDEGVEALLAAADDAGMFAEVDYEADTMIADAGTATLRIVADGEEYVHEAYALGIGGPPGAEGEETPERQALADFLEQLGDLPALVGESELGPQEPFEPIGYQFVAQEIPDLTVFEVEPTVVPWPPETGIALADALECTEVARETVGDLFESANELTFFDDDGVTWELAVRPVLPGRDC